MASETTLEDLQKRYRRARDKARKLAPLGGERAEQAQAAFEAVARELEHFLEVNTTCTAYQ